MGFSLRSLDPTKVVKKAVKGVGDLAENTVKEVDRNKNTIIGATLAPVTGGASLALAAKDDTTFGREVQRGFSEVGDAINWNENRGLYMGALAGALTGGLGYLGAAGGLASAGIGAGVGAAAGRFAVDEPHAQAVAQAAAQAEANRITQEANMMSKQSMLANELSMTARRALSKKVMKNLRKNTPTSAEQNLGGEQQKLG